MGQRVTILWLMVFGVTSLAPCLGQEGSATQEAGRVSQTISGTVVQSVMILVRANPETRPEQIRATLLAGVKQTDSKCAEVIVREVQPEVIDQVEAMLRGVETSIFQQAGSSAVLLKGSSLGSWEFRLGEPSREMATQLEVLYEGSESWVTYPAVPPEKAAVPSFVVVSVRNGRYEFYPEVNKPRPVRYRIVTEDENGNRRNVNEGSFPLLDKFYLIHLRDFSGNKDLLFKAVTDKDKVANPFTAIDERTNVTLVIGDLNARSGVTGIGIVSHDLVVSVSGVQERKPARAWMLFPLTKEEAEEECRKIESLTDPSMTLPDEIRKRAVLTNQQEKSVVEQAGARWYELTRSGSSFESRIRLVNNAAQFAELASKFPQVYRVLVWEFEDAEKGIREAIYVEGNRLYKMEDIDGWFNALQKATSK